MIKTMGARPMARLIQENVKKPFADELLFGKLMHGGHVTLKVKDGKLHFDSHDHREGVCYKWHLTVIIIAKK